MQTIEVKRDMGFYNIQTIENGIATGGYLIPVSEPMDFVLELADSLKVSDDEQVKVSL